MSDDNAYGKAYGRAMLWEESGGTSRGYIAALRRLAGELRQQADELDKEALKVEANPNIYWQNISTHPRDADTVFDVWIVAKASYSVRVRWDEPFGFRTESSDFKELLSDRPSHWRPIQ